MAENLTRRGLKKMFGNEHRMSLLIDMLYSIFFKTLHIEANKIVPSSYVFPVTFNEPFNTVPAGLPYLKVYRIGQFISGKYGPKEVQWYMTTADKLTATGFEIEIEATESLTGVIVEYLFYEKR